MESRNGHEMAAQSFRRARAAQSARSRELPAPSSKGPSQRSIGPSRYDPIRYAYRAQPRGWRESLVLPLEAPPENLGPLLPSSRRGDPSSPLQESRLRPRDHDRLGPRGGETSWVLIPEGAMEGWLSIHQVKARCQSKVDPSPFIRKADAEKRLGRRTYFTSETADRPEGVVLRFRRNGPWGLPPLSTPKVMRLAARLDGFPRRTDAWSAAGWSGAHLRLPRPGREILTSHLAFKANEVDASRRGCISPWSIPPFDTLLADVPLYEARLLNHVGVALRLVEEFDARSAADFRRLVRTSERARKLFCLELFHDIPTSDGPALIEHYLRAWEDVFPFSVAVKREADGRCIGVSAKLGPDALVKFYWDEERGAVRFEVVISQPSGGKPHPLLRWIIEHGISGGTEAVANAICSVAGWYWGALANVEARTLDTAPIRQPEVRRILRRALAGKGKRGRQRRTLIRAFRFLAQMRTGNLVESHGLRKADQTILDSLASLGAAEKIRAGARKSRTFYRLADPIRWWAFRRDVWTPLRLVAAELGVPASEIEAARRVRRKGIRWELSPRPKRKARRARPPRETTQASLGVVGEVAA